MRRMTTAITIAMVFALAGTPHLGCQEEGPAEKAGRAMDEAAENLSDEIEEAKEKLSE